MVMGDTESCAWLLLSLGSSTSKTCAWSRSSLPPHGQTCGPLGSTFRFVLVCALPSSHLVSVESLSNRSMLLFLGFVSLALAQHGLGHGRGCCTPLAHHVGRGRRFRVLDLLHRSRRSQGASFLRQTPIRSRSKLFHRRLRRFTHRHGSTLGTWYVLQERLQVESSHIPPPNLRGSCVKRDDVGWKRSRRNGPARPRRRIALPTDISPLLHRYLYPWHRDRIEGRLARSRWRRVHPISFHNKIDGLHRSSRSYRSEVRNRWDEGESQPVPIQATSWAPSIMAAKPNGGHRKERSGRLDCLRAPSPREGCARLPWPRLYKARWSSSTKDLAI